MTLQEALKLRQLIVKASSYLEDADAKEGVLLFPSWQVGTAYSVGERVGYGEKLYKCVQSHTSQEDWIPTETPALWTEVGLPSEIPVWKQPTGASDAYNTGDKVHFPTADDPVYISLIDANVWSPEAYPQGWELVE